jgi:membrane protein implicated in regulation of membrane protease activity
MVMDLIRDLGPWTWWVVGLILLGLEIIVPGSFFVWFGVSAMIVGAAALLIDWPWEAQIVVFAILALVLVIVGRRFFSGRGASDRPYLNLRADRYIGTTHVIADPIVNGQGRVRIDDTNWRITGPDLPAGSRVKVVATDGPVLKVEAEGYGV